MTLYYLENK